MVLLFTFNGLGTPSDMGKFFPTIHQTIDAGWNPIAPSIGSQFQSECAVRTSVFLFLKWFFFSPVLLKAKMFDLTQSLFEMF